MNKIDETGHGLKERRLALIEEMRGIGNRVKEEKRNLSTEEKEQLGKLDQEQEQLAERAETIEKLERVNHLTLEERKEQVISSPWHIGAKPYKSVEERNDAYCAWFKHTTSGSTPENRRAAERFGIDVSNPTMRFDWIPWDSKGHTPEQRSSTGQIVASNVAGGYNVPIDQSFMGQLDVALKYYGDVLNWATIYDTATGAPLVLTNQNDTGNLAETVGEGGQENVLDMSFGRMTLNSYKYDTIVKVSTELETDSIINLVSDIAERSGERIGRRLNNDIFVGTGANESITGFLPSVATGYTSTSTTVGGPIYDDLIGLLESVDESYQNRPRAGWVFPQGFRALLRQVIDGNGRPLFWNYMESLSNGISKMLLDHEYHINPAMANWNHTGSGSGALGNVAAIFGDLSKVCVRRVRGGDMGGMIVTRLDQVYRTQGFIGYLTEGRFDAGYRNSGTDPIKALRAPLS